MTRDRALELLVFGILLIVFGGLQTVTGRDMLSKTSFLLPAPRWVGGIIVTVGGAGVLIGAIVLARVS